MDQYKKNSFLRNIPVVIDPAQRYALDSISFALDAIELSYGRILNTLKRYDQKSILDIKSMDRSAVFSDAWTIIDRSHILLQLIESIFIKEKKKKDSDKEIVGINLKNEPWIKTVENYYNEYNQNVTLLRNVMDHLRGNVCQLSKTKKVKSPIQGTLSYFYTTDELVKSKIIYIIALTNNAVNEEKQSSRFASPSGKLIDIPVSNINLAANDREFSTKVVKISKLYKDTVQIKSIINEDFAKLVIQKIKSVADIKGIKLDDLTKSGGHSLTYIMEMVFPDVVPVEK